MNGQYLSALPAAELLEPVQRQLAILGVRTSRDLAPLIDAVKARSRTITQIAEQIALRVDASRIARDEKGTQLIAKLGDRFAANLRLAHEALTRCDAGNWDAPFLAGALKELAESAGAKLGDMMQPIRVALTGGTVSEPVPELLVAVGRDESLKRIASSSLK
jgi:glutamyl-tRNA synthetase